MSLCDRHGPKQQPHAAADGKVTLKGVGGPIREGTHEFQKNWGRGGKSPKSVYNFLLSVNPAVSSLETLAI